MANNVEMWKECLECCSGGHLLSFGGNENLSQNGKCY